MNNKVYYFTIDDTYDIYSVTDIVEYETNDVIKINLNSKFIKNHIVTFKFVEPGWQTYSEYTRIHIVVYKLDDYSRTNYENDHLKPLIMNVLSNFLTNTIRKEKIKRLKQ